MYDELVERLRAQAEVERFFTGEEMLYSQAADAIEELTGFVQEAERDRDEYRERLDKANDAIEELQQTAKHYKGCSDDWYKEACDYKAMLPRWIPVTERLPDTPGEYMVAYHPCYWDKVYDEIKVGLDSFRGKTSWAKKKYKRVTHWMPLPEPPKEEE